MPKPFSLLLVDDDPNDLELFQRALANLPIDATLHTARDGFEALELLHVRGSEDLPKLLVVDYKMPRMDGVQLLAELQKEQRFRQIPAVVLTSSHDRRDIERAYAAGANAYLVKPVNFNAFNRQVEVLLTFWLQHNHTVASPGERL